MLSGPLGWGQHVSKRPQKPQQERTGLILEEREVSTTTILSEHLAFDMVDDGRAGCVGLGVPLVGKRAKNVSTRVRERVVQLAHAGELRQATLLGFAESEQADDVARVRVEDLRDGVSGDSLFMTRTMAHLIAARLALDNDGRALKEEVSLGVVEKLRRRRRRLTSPGSKAVRSRRCAIALELPICLYRCSPI